MDFVVICNYCYVDGTCDARGSVVSEGSGLYGQSQRGLPI